MRLTWPLLCGSWRWHFYRVAAGPDHQKGRVPEQSSIVPLIIVFIVGSTLIYATFDMPFTAIQMRRYKRTSHRIT